jgi:5S rRNA maturation endonuclease (ribonuclease M5)
MKKEIYDCEKARSLCLVQTLAKLGHFPNRKTEKEAWFLSPFRNETQASFKVSIKENYWIDFATFEGGSTIDLVTKLKQYSLPDALEFLSDVSSNIPIYKKQATEREASTLEIQKIQSLQHPALFGYLKSRGITVSIAKKYAKEVWYNFNQRTFFAIGLKNQSGGWELRNKYFKTSASPKTFTHIKNGHQNLIVVEGMFDLFSIEILANEVLRQSDIIVLNSVAFTKRIVPLFRQYESVMLYLDNDFTRDKATTFLMNQHTNVADGRERYKDFKDANEKLIS